MSFPENVYVGTSGWLWPDWQGSFYPVDMKTPGWIEFYAREFTMVEIESTYRSIPARSMLTAWKENTPPGFVFSARLPGVITHQKILQSCNQELMTFLSSMEILGDRLGPLLIQFPYFNKNTFASRAQFDKLLHPFVKSLPKDFKFALEIRNKNWISWDFIEFLRDHSIAFVVVAQAWMPSIEVLARALDLVTADFFYARFVGDPNDIAPHGARGEKLLEDKCGEMTLWAAEIKKIAGSGVRTYVSFNNQYAGFAPGSAKIFRDLWEQA